MKVSEFKNMMRSVVREELDFYTSKIINEIKEIKAGTEIITERTSATTKKVPDFKGKYSSLLNTMTEGMDTDIDTTPISILDVPLTRGREDNAQLSAVEKALTRDYSSLVKKMEKPNVRL